ncbi:MAG: phycobilisome linker polypeptide [Alkalinema sp. RU_4_3]|nr:phycobilisome linker polypeptide [Alkalinema sp. RU_4_3]
MLMTSDRVFVYEVEGLRQTPETEQAVASIRNSTTMIQVPFSRMGDFMQRMNRLGGRIVAIRSSGSEQQDAAPTE